ncbi:hypothetical protein [Pseudofrankia sp. BMG5.37]|uniref:hypothetical protein n=1 Tax=Pseudofrankia sp. BMG5.37 TaxID=3050035 RepID=UPI0028955C7F|nr:hypothetical protein [Pseudofrankia sp. BMG5.37]MDT3440473.1 hypothetical protein [Pseudofrankia sp. BMG5.37]
MGLCVFDILDADGDLAAFALVRFLEPALRVRVRRVARTSVPWLCSCHGSTLCDTCGGLINKFLCVAQAKLRVCAAGGLPTTRAGVPLNELAVIASGMTEPAATARLGADEAGRELFAYTARRTRPVGGPAPRGQGQGPAPAAHTDEAWLRACWAQLVLHPTRKLDVDIVREDAVRRGMPAKPMDALDASPARGPLAAEPLADAAVRELIIGLHAQVVDPFQLPATEKKFGVAVVQARAALDRGRALLRAHDPNLYETLVAGPVAGPVAGRGYGRLPDRPGRPGRAPRRPGSRGPRRAGNRAAPRAEPKVPSSAWPVAGSTPTRCRPPSGHAMRCAPRSGRRSPRGRARPADGPAGHRSSSCSPPSSTRSTAAGPTWWPAAGGCSAWRRRRRAPSSPGSPCWSPPRA